jgi:excisionase family DNA binding protein
METIMTVPDVAKYLKISKAKIYMMIKNKQIPHIKIGKNVRVRESDLVRWLEKQTEPAKT